MFSVPLLVLLYLVLYIKHITCVAMRLMIGIESVFSNIESLTLMYSYCYTYQSANQPSDTTTDTYIIIIVSPIIIWVWN